MQKTQRLAGPAAPPASPQPFSLAGTTLLAVMATALVIIVAGAVARFYPAWRPAYLVVACFLVAVEAALVRYRMLHGRHVSVGALPYLAAELFALMALMRVVASLGVGLGGLPELAGRWARAPLAAIDGPFVASLIAGLACALAVRAGLRELATLEPPAQIVRPEHRIDAEFYRVAAEARECEAVERLASGVGWGGLLALLAMVAQLADLGPWGGPAAPLRPAVGLAGIAYLVCGALLFSRARLGLLRARWHRDEMAVEPGVARRWRWQSLALVAAVAALGLALPRSYGAELLAALRAAALAAANLLGLAFLAVAMLALGLAGLILTIPALLLALLAGLGRVPPLPAGPIIPPLPTPAPQPPPAEPPLAPGVIFWVCIGLLAAYALWTVLRRQAWAAAALARLRAGLLAPLAAWLALVWGGAAGYARKVGVALAERLRRPEPPAPTPRVPRPRLRRLGPAGLVRYFYASTVRRAGRGGPRRRAAETPYEYAARLTERLPDAAEEVDGLTEAYLAAAYAPRPTTPDEARRARGWWARLKRRLRGG